MWWSWYSPGLMCVVAPSARASLVRICSGSLPAARSISLIVSITLVRVLGLMDRRLAAYSCLSFSKPRLRICGYNKEFLEELCRIVDGETISGEQKGQGTYYRWELSDYAVIEEVLGRILPFLKVKRVLVEEWLGNRKNSFLRKHTPPIPSL